MQLTFRILPFPGDIEIRDIFVKYLEKEINVFNSESLLKEIAEIDDFNSTTILLIKSVVGKSLPLCSKDYIRDRGGVWSISRNGMKIKVTSTRKVLDLLELGKEFKARQEAM
jgi:hypothetical protein